MTKYDTSTPPKMFFHCAPKADACDHDWGSWRDFPTGGEQFCTKCGMGAAQFTLMHEDGKNHKYVTRHADKGGAEDCKKAIQYFLFILANQYDVVGTVEYADCSEVSDGPRYYPPSE